MYKIQNNNQISGKIVYFYSPMVQTIALVEKTPQIWRYADTCKVIAPLKHFLLLG